MKTFWSRNIDRRGRLIRAAIALVFLVGALLAWRTSAWLAPLLAISGSFILFEAARGWCALRACGIKTRF